MTGVVSQILSRGASRSAACVAAVMMVTAVGCTEFSDEGSTSGDIGVDVAAPDTDTRTPDVAATDSGPDPGPPDVTVDLIIAGPECESDPGAFGCPCSENVDCNSGYCIEGPDGLMCTKTCIEECDDGYSCVTTGGLGPDPVSVCVPQHLTLCRPCQTNAECVNDLVETQLGVCVPAANPADGSFCATSCAGGLACPDDFACVTQELEGGITAQLCQPTSGECGCRPTWSALGYSTTCSIDNDFGSCPGIRGCGANGLGSCEGTIPGPEICNDIDDDCDGATDNLVEVSCAVTNALGSCPGLLQCNVGGVEECVGDEAQAEVCNTIDDDCDGDTDEGTCSDGLECTADSCSPDGTCIHTLIAGWCQIDGACVPGGVSNPADPCERCQPGITQTGWADADGASCNDGEACTWNDKCAGGTCSGTPYVCNDGLNCTADLCDGEGDCLQELTGDFCLIDGACVTGGSLKPDGSCFFCSPTQSPKNWFPNDGGACDDGDPCTESDNCAGITCTGTAYSCDDGNSCTDDQCLGDGTCDHIPATTTCTIQGACYADGTVRPGSPCQVCDALVNNIAWTVAEVGSPCDDGNACTHSDQCGAGLCQGVPYACVDGLPCTTDNCDGDGGCLFPPIPGKCAIDFACYDHGDGQPGNSCLRCDAQLNPTDWLPQAPGTACTDDQGCTTNDVCNDSAICVGEGQSCDDGKWCTQDDCDGSGGCVHTATTACHIDGGCYTDGTENPSNTCQICNVGISTTTWSPKGGNPCNDGDPCTYSDQCVGGACVGTSYSCNDGLPCTIDICNGSPGSCDHEIANGWCQIGGSCYQDNGTNPSNSCQQCNDLYPSQWSPKTGSCNDGQSCTSGDTCNGGVCVGTPIGDGYEDNDNASFASTLQAKNDNSSWNQASSTNATLFGPGDVDWYKFKMNDNTNTDGEPDVRVDLSSIPSGSDYELCVYLDCDDPGNGEEAKNCNGSSWTFNNHPGCCSDNTGSQSESITFQTNCKNGGILPDDDTGDIYIRVRAFAAEDYTCSSYTLTWGDE